ncbi:MAG: hypothetical protein ABIB97_00445 [Patescibacteria group bacterium]
MVITSQVGLCRRHIQTPIKPVTIKMPRKTVSIGSIITSQTDGYDTDDKSHENGVEDNRYQAVYQIREGYGQATEDNHAHEGKKGACSQSKLSQDDSHSFTPLLKRTFR